MRLSFTVHRGGGPDSVDVEVRLDREATAQELHDALTAAVPGARGALWVRGAPVALEEPVASCGLREGDRVGLGGPAPTRPIAGVRVAAGPDTGLLLPLRAGVLGRADGLSDPDVSRRHLLLEVGAAVRVADAGSTNGSVLDGSELTSARVWEPEVPLRTGSTLLVHGPVEPAAGVAPDGACGLTRSRPPRLLPPPDAVRVELPREPVEHAPRGLPVLALLAPLVTGVVLALVLGPRFLLFALLSPVALAAGWLSDRRQGRVTRERERRAYDAALATAHAELGAAREREGRLRRAAHPDAGAVLLTAVLPGRRLWERRPGDPDHLDVRLGTADLTSRVELVGGEAARVRDVPVVLPLAEVGVLGLAGPRSLTRGLARWVVGQLAVLHRPRDLEVVVLTGRDAEADWSWLAHLPHARDGRRVRLGNDSETVAARVAELVALVRARGHDGRDRADVLVVMDGARALRRLPGVAGLLRDGPGVGVRLLCLDEEEGLLPEECTATVVCRGTHGTVRRSRHEDVPDVLLEPVGAAWADELARGLLPLRDPDEEGPGGLPPTARLVDLLGPGALDPHVLAATWGRTTTAVLGAGTDGPFRVDLVRDGPHALVAGTTGSGKSELLQALVVSLAAGNRPEAMGFVLVDYKGGSAFRDCARLPHVVGTVTDLDPHLVQRALTSLGAELTRRERVLAAAGASDLPALERAGGALGRLVVVIDEFASLARELPDFVSGLVGIAQRGRSLGLHLVLATQRPSGVVSPEIRANTDLRLALRMSDPGESSDVVDVPDAARIPRELPGRALVRLGQGVLAPVQVARVSGCPPASRPRVVASAVLRPWSCLGQPPAEAPAGSATGPSDLELLVDAMVDAGRGAPRPVRPWLPPLPDVVRLEDLLDTTGTSVGPGAPYGLVDQPRRQAQPVATWDPEREGHLLVVGAPRSGRTGLLLALACSLATRYPAGRLHLHALDCAGGQLLPLAGLPHCGGVVTRDEPERVGRLLARLTQEVARRQVQGAAAGLPHVVLLVDGWEGFSSSLGELDGGALQDQVLAVLREGAAVGVHVVVAGDRSLVLGRLGQAVPDRLVLRLADRADYAVVGVDPRTVPDHPPVGRGLRLPGGDELQVALAPPVADVVAACGRGRPAADPQVSAGSPPFRVEALPSRVSLASLHPPGPALFAVLGVGGDELDVVGTDLACGPPALLVVGAARTGRSTALLALARSFLDQGAQVVLVTPRPSPLQALDGLPGVRALLADAATGPLAEALDPDGPVVVLLDDAELLRDGPGATLLDRLASGGRPDCALVAAGSPEGLGGGFTGWHVRARQSRRGLLLSPRSVADGELVGCRLPRSAVTAQVVPGRGLAHLGDGRLVPVQVPV